MNSSRASVAVREVEVQPSAASEQTAKPSPFDAQSGSSTVAAARKANGRKWAFMLGLGAAVTGASAYWYSQRAVVSTDDAQIDADVVAVPARVAGNVKSIAFREN